MNIALWIIAGLLAAAFLASGLAKLFLTNQQLVARGMGFAETFSPAAVKAIGVVEILGAAGLIVPAALDVAPVLVPLAALGFVLLMAGATVVHVRRHEFPALASTFTFLALAAFVAVGRVS